MPLTKAKLVQIGSIAPDFEGVQTDGTKRRLSDFRGRRVLLSFFRFAACPVCLYNIDRLKQQAKMLSDADIVTICVFRSTPMNIQYFAKASVGDDSLALSDEKGKSYTKFGTPKSIKSGMIGFSEMAKNMKKYSSYMDIVGMGKDILGTNMAKLTYLPADFMINEDGVVVDLLRATSAKDTMSFERVEAFIPKNKRCKCCKKDCISPRCRAEHEEIKKQSESMLFIG